VNRVCAGGTLSPSPRRKVDPQPAFPGAAFLDSFFLLSSVGGKLFPHVRRNPFSPIRRLSFYRFHSRLPPKEASVILVVVALFLPPFVCSYLS